MQRFDLILHMQEDAQLNPPALTVEQERKAELYAEREELESRLADVLDELRDLGEAI